ncbi:MULTISPECIES: glycoside hydrolase family 2 protein [unclassified Beijerinckia]|uniref:glycoside hydrolase family 2 protein n=1 Tax=unclassified Beijerinckia TaxID=2638183 RepID=UPI000896AAA6|nr:MULTISPECIES: glycoside hydrolase family 2 protein [unclassified Beijerinckia]MDH7797284.1 beta-mannosidase [Beijerinckia sp. GAS462]SEC79384.1 beta-mannosidase [Beijerinckia sp. 28-YEA-48]
MNPAFGIGIGTGDAASIAPAWSFALTLPDACQDAAAAQRLTSWAHLAALAPAEAVMKNLGLSLPGEAASLHDCDAWYQATLAGPGEVRLVFEGLATFAEIWLDDVKLASSANMFRPLELTVTLTGHHRLSFVCRSLSRRLSQVEGKRARWRVAMIPEQKLRFVRTSLLGHMPGWCPPVAIVGPWRPVHILPARIPRLRDLKVQTSWADGSAQLRVSFDPAEMKAATVAWICAGQTMNAELRDGRWSLDTRVEGVAPWWPHSHGTPQLYPLEIEIDGSRHSVTQIGFRSVAIDRGADGRDFCFRINGTPVFARGVCWSPPDLVDFPATREVYARELTLARDAGINLIRVCGTTVYEPRIFHDLADELGIMIWQDAMLANFDYPVGDAAFRAELRHETEAFLAQRQGSPSLVVYGGGSEILQQAAMLGLPRERWSNDFIDGELADIVAAWRPDVAYVVNSPSGGELPFVVDQGVGHYYGVGAYRRPLDDARRADVAFAAECLAFANLPSRARLAKRRLDGTTPLERWKALVPRDRGADWDFEDIRHHYMTLLYDVDPQHLKGQDFDRYVAIGQAAAAEVMQAVFTEWRRPGSRTAGGLVLMWKDLAPALGWGVVDHSGEPKSGYYALKRAFAPVQLIVSDEGVNGLRLHVVNETDRPIDVLLTLDCLTEGHRRAASGEQSVTVAARGHYSVAATTLLGAFFDTTYTYRFGPPAHDANVVRLIDKESGVVLQEATHFPMGRGDTRHDLGLRAELHREADGFHLKLTTDRLAQTVVIAADGFLPQDNYFHLAPGRECLVALQSARASLRAPTGSVSALNGTGKVSF